MNALAFAQHLAHRYRIDAVAKQSVRLFEISNAY